VFNIGPSELILVLILALVIFGPSKIPELGRTLGSGIREFRRATQEISTQFNSVLDEPKKEEKKEDKEDTKD